MRPFQIRLFYGHAQITALNLRRPGGGNALPCHADIAGGVNRSVKRLADCIEGQRIPGHQLAVMRQGISG
ncbi:hypothetical protein D3C75_591680 [compost metagenome]